MNDPIILDVGEDDSDDQFDSLVELIDAIGEIPSVRTTLPGHRSDGTGNLVDGLDELLATIVEYGCACVIISPTSQGSTFVQCIATPVGFRLEAVSNVFLWGTANLLDGGREAMLRDLGWNPPDVPADPAERADDWREDGENAVNWWFDVEGTATTYAIAALLLRTLLSVYAIGGEDVFEVEVFPSDHQEWEWVDGGLVSVD